MKRAALLVLLAGCGQEPPPPAPPAFSATALPEPRALEPVPPGEFPRLDREVPELELPPMPPSRPFAPEPAWDRHHGYRIAHPVGVETVPLTGWYARNTPSVLESLAFLAAVQKEDGSWEPLPDCADCGQGAEADGPATSALALLAFTRAGIPTREPFYQGRVRLDVALRRGLQRVISDQDAAGTRSLRPRAMEAAALAGAQDSTFCLDQARRSAEQLLSAPLAGADADSIAWAVEALFPTYPPQRAHDEWVSRARSALDALPPPGDGTALARSAIARMLLDRHTNDPRVHVAMDAVLADKPSSDRLDLTYWQVATRGMFMFDGPNGARWKAWSTSLLPILEDRRRSATCPRAVALIALTSLEIHRPVWRSRYGHRSA